jgi:hypothetical protein
MVLYVAARCQDAERFGVVKLNKIVVFADFTAFARTGSPISGVEYMREKNGPVPRKMKPVLAQLERERSIAIAQVPIFGKTEHRVLPLREPNLDLFTPWDIAIIDEVIAMAWDKNGTELSDFSHGRAWEVAGESGVTIPYEAAFISDRPLTAADIARTRELNRRFGWE